MRKFKAVILMCLGLMLTQNSLISIASCDGLISRDALHSVGIELTTSDVDELDRLSTAHGSSDSNGVNVGFDGLSVGLSGSNSSSDKRDELKTNKRSATHYTVSSMPLLGMADAYIKCRQLEEGKNSVLLDPRINGLASLDIGVSTLTSTDRVELVGLSVRPIAQFGGISESGSDLVSCYVSENSQAAYSVISNKPGVKVIVGANAVNGANLSRVLHCDRKPLPIAKTTANTASPMQYLPVVINLEFATHDKFQFSFPWSGGGVPTVDTLEMLQDRISALEATAGQVNVTQHFDKTFEGMSGVNDNMGMTKELDIAVNFTNERSVVDAEAGLITHGTISDKQIFKTVSVVWMVDKTKTPCSENITTVNADGRNALSISGRCSVVLPKGVHHLKLKTSIGTWGPDWRKLLKDVSGYIRVSSVPVRALTVGGNVDTENKVKREE